MPSSEHIRASLGATIRGPGGAVDSADRLCNACVDLLEVDGAAISVVHDGTTRGTLGSSGDLSRRLDEYQFTFGEGPCLEAVRIGSPMLATDLEDPEEQRWPIFRAAMLRSGVRAVFAFPVRVAASSIGALDLFRKSEGGFSADVLNGALWAAELAALPLLDIAQQNHDWDSVGTDEDAWLELSTLERVEVYQATGMIMAQLDVDSTEALVRLRGLRAFSHDLTSSEVAWAVVDRRLRFDTGKDSAGESGGAS